MTLRPPRSSMHSEPETALGYEIAQEKAAALGRLGRALETALSALSEHDRADGRHGGTARRRFAPADPLRERLVQEASDALWCFVVQREACGLIDHRPLIRAYGIPAEVRNRMGAFGTTTRPRSK
jgi:uncharacterized protein DUF6665